MPLEQPPCRVVRNAPSLPAVGGYILPVCRPGWSKLDVTIDFGTIGVGFIQNPIHWLLILPAKTWCSWNGTLILTFYFLSASDSASSFSSTLDIGFKRKTTNNMSINFPSDLRLVKVLDGETCSDFHRKTYSCKFIYGETSMKCVFFLERNGFMVKFQPFVEVMICCNTPVMKWPEFLTHNAHKCCCGRCVLLFCPEDSWMV